MTTEPPPDPPYTVVLAPGARRALTETLPSTAAFAAWEFISGPLGRRPRIVGVLLRAPFEGLWRARRGEYGVRYRIDEAHRRVIVLDVDHRRDAYHS
ncbi:MAG TPA: type II toxin-antitoxin system RelE/ParE family toxin [Actinomycetes bacterium]|nr:type II toxin-antitoxin system RelE/ParE family toxin [Actinomycetes bacterium]